MKNSLKTNFVYNFVYQILISSIPLITVPYISRVIGAENIGIYSYTYSVVYYFMVFSMIGINNYGNRTIAKNKDNKEKLSKNFLGIYCIQIIMSLIMIMFYLIYVLLFAKNYLWMYMIQGICLLSCVFDVNWFFFGLEKFKLTVTRNIIIKILTLVGIFVFVRKSSDLIFYTFILAIGMLISQLSLFFLLKKEISFVKLTKKDILVHLKPCLILFIPVIAVSIYKIMDKIMIGNISSMLEVGYYEQAEKIIMIPIGLVNALSTVMVPRISNLVVKKDEKSILDYIDKSVSFMMFLACPICLGLISISNIFVPIFLGNEFLKSINLISILSVTIIFISFANIIRSQYLLPRECDKIIIISVCCGAIINFISNILLIPKYASLGAGIGTLIAEFTVMIIQIYAVKNKLPMKKYIKTTFVYFIKSIFMFCILYVINFIKMNLLVKMIFIILSGMIIYFILNYKYILYLLNNLKREK